MIVRLTAVAAVAGITGALISGCATPTASPAGPATVQLIGTDTPSGVRAQQIVDMVNSDWPIGQNGVKTLATSPLIDDVGIKLERLWFDRPLKVTRVEMGTDTAKLRLLTPYGARQDVEIHLDDDSTLVDRFDVELQPPTVESWEDVDALLGGSGARYSYQVSKVTNGRCEPVHGTNTSQSLPLASIFKLYVLYAVATAAEAGTLSWDEQLTITERGKAVGSSGLDELPIGARVPVRTVAEKMIANSDNMATDMLIDRVGTQAVERALVEAGHHDPASMTPFPTMHEMFSIGWGKPDMREQWKAAVASGRAEERARLLSEANSRPLEPDPERTRSPASVFGAEWYGSAEDICRVHAGLQAKAFGAAAPVRQIVSVIPGIDLDAKQWPYVGAKAGNLPGDLTFSWYAEDRTGQGWVVSFQLNWPRFHGPNAAGWVLSIAKQVFALLPQTH